MSSYDDWKLAAPPEKPEWFDDVVAILETYSIDATKITLDSPTDAISVLERVKDRIDEDILSLQMLYNLSRKTKTCRMQRVNRNNAIDEFECQHCYGHTWVPVYARPEFCCHCGLPVQEG